MPIWGSGLSNVPVSQCLNKTESTSFFFPSLMYFGVGKGVDFNVWIFLFYSKNAEIGNIFSSQPVWDLRAVLTLELA